jgi:hypothetical protein
MIPNTRVTDLLVKLNKLTSKGAIEWAVADPPRALLRGTDDHIPFFAETTYKGRNFAVYENRYQNFNVDLEALYWTESLVLCLLDDENRVLWKYDRPSPALRDLFDTVRRKVSKIDSLIDDLLSDEQGEENE